MELTIPLMTATGASDEPGDLAGYGPLDAETVRDLLAPFGGGGVDWRYSIIDDNGTLLAHDRLRSSGDGAAPVETNPTRRSPSPALSRWIVARDRTCRAPGCTVPARVCDIDHTIAHSRGGPTSHDNLGLLCRHHHRLKHEGGWTLTQPSPGHFEWQSPTGRIYRT